MHVKTHIYAHGIVMYSSIVNATPVFLNLLIYQWCIVANISSFGESACDRGSSGCLNELTERRCLAQPVTELLERAMGKTREKCKNIFTLW